MNRVHIYCLTAAFAFSGHVLAAVVNDEPAFRAEMLKISSQPPMVKDDFTVNPLALQVDKKASFPNQVNGHKLNIERLKAINDTAASNFKESDSVKVVRASTIVRDSLMPYAVTYHLSAERATKLKEQGYLLKNINESKNIKMSTANPDGSTTAEACNAQGQCADVDPMVAFFMMVLDAITKEFMKDKPFGPSNDLVKFIQQPSGGPNSALVLAREFILRGDQGELAKLIRDPIKRPIEIIEKGLQFLNNDNGIVAQALTRPGAVIFNGWDPRPQDNGEISKAIRDPIKCTIGHLWGGCD